MLSRDPARLTFLRAAAMVKLRYGLKAGMAFAGPAIVEERESTLIIGARGRAWVDERLQIVVELANEV